MTAQHGTTSRYTTGCRCTKCRQAARDYQRERRRIAEPDPDELSNLLHELFPLGLTDDCPARQTIR